MSSVFVTGTAGSGKTTLAHHLSELGYQAYNMDEGSHKQRVGVDGKPVDLATINKQDPRWRKKYPNAWIDDIVLPWFETAKRSPKPVFFCGVVKKQKQYYPHFDKIILLKIDPDTMVARLGDRSNTDYGKDPFTQNQLVAHLAEWQNELVSTYQAIPIDARQSTEKIAHQIIEIAS